MLLILSFSNLFALVELNSASAEELLELNGIGKAKSLKIVHYRETSGCFKSLDELARVDGVSEQIVASNRSRLALGICKKPQRESPTLLDSLKDVLYDPVNLLFVFIIFVLGVLDYRTTKDLKSQIVSVGVLGTFVGIFIGLQAFDPDDIISSVNDILVGLKTAFFTSIVGMTMATTLSIIEKFQKRELDE